MKLFVYVLLLAVLAGFGFAAGQDLWRYGLRAAQHATASPNYPPQGGVKDYGKLLAKPPKGHQPE